MTSPPGPDPAAGLELRIERPASPAALETAWRALEAEAPGHAFFQGWTWLGCQVEARFPDPVLLRAEAEGRTVGLALCNRRGRRLCLAESGDPALDAPYVEHNAPLVAAGFGHAAPALLAAAWGIGGLRSLVLSGTPEPLAAALPGPRLRWRVEPAPRIELAALRKAGGDWLATLSANARYQLRRSRRAFGDLALDRAGPAEAERWLDALIALHQDSWRRRGKPGAFATESMRRFHHALVARAAARGELDLLRIADPQGPLGYLYNLRRGGWIAAYQSGIDYGRGGAHGKPGLTCHHLAVERALAAGDEVYDFLAGAARYKLSLANAERALAWAELARPGDRLAPLRRLGMRVRARLAASFAH
jgi:CelD/BcsL family acetyltransferase involved in cellulose biosynthesis